jgi:ABC-2 type transport system permease protein
VNKLLSVSIFEFKRTAANKAFVIVTLLGPILILAFSVLPGLLATRPELMNKEGRVALVGGDAGLREALAKALGPRGLEIVESSSDESARAGVADGSLAGAVVLPSDWQDADSFTYYSPTGTDAMVYETLSSVVGAQATARKLDASGIDPALMARVLAVPSLRVVKAGREGDSDSGKADFMGILLSAMAFVMFIYMTVLLYGQMIGRSVVQEKMSKTVEIMLSSVSVVQEKMSKTVEIMLSSVSPSQLMFGKILGNGAAGILQYGFWTLMVAALSRLLGPRFGISMPEAVSMSNMGWLALFFLLGFFLYSSLYAAAGAAAEDEQHMGQIAMPIILLLVLPLMLISPIIMNPSSPIAMFFSYFPFSAPMVMLVRVVVGSYQPWEPWLAVAILLASIGVLAFLAAKIFRVGILMTGKRPKPAEVLRWLWTK